MWTQIVGAPPPAGWLRSSRKCFLLIISVYFSVQSDNPAGKHPPASLRKTSRDEAELVTGEEEEEEEEDVPEPSHFCCVCAAEPEQDLSCRDIQLSMATCSLSHWYAAHKHCCMNELFLPPSSSPSHHHQICFLSERSKPSTPPPARIDVFLLPSPPLCSASRQVEPKHKEVGTSSAIFESSIVKQYLVIVLCKLCSSLRRATAPPPGWQQRLSSEKPSVPSWWSTQGKQKRRIH